MKMKYILVTGGVISGIGKGVTAASLGKCSYKSTKICQFTYFLSTSIMEV